MADWRPPTGVHPLPTAMEMLDAELAYIVDDGAGGDPRPSHA